MKKIILSLVALFSMSANSFADGLTATLQQGDNMQAFYGVDAFKQAYEAANDGAVITLSSGIFNPVDTVAKSIIINGNNALHDSYAKTSVDHITILADNVKVEGVYFNGDVQLGKVSNCHIQRCFLNNKLSATETHTNTLVDQCVVKYDYAIGVGVNYVIKNSTLEYFGSMNTVENKAQITNCVVWEWFSNYDGINKQPYAIYMNNALGFYNSGTFAYECSVNSEFYFNCFFRSYSSYSSKIGTVSFRNGCINEGNVNRMYDYHPTFSFPSIIKWTMKGMDGTVVGIDGGSGFTALPSIPRITNSTIDSCTDAQGNINVKISATTGSN